MKKLVVLALVTLVWAAGAWAQPAIRAENGVLNASSYAPDIARGSWFVVFGTGMGPASIAIHPAAPYPFELSGTKITFTPASGGTAVEARMWYTSAAQAAALLPSTVAAGDYDVRVIYNGQSSQPRRVKVVERNFGFATQAQNGAGPVQATYGGYNLNRFTTGNIDPWEIRPAQAGDRVDLWGTGLGPDPQSDETGEASGDLKDAAQVKVFVGDLEIAPAYAGRSGGSPGLDQVVFTLPSNVGTGCFVRLRVSVGGRFSNESSLAIAPSGQQACTHPTLSAGDLARLDRGEQLTHGDFTLSSVVTKISLGGVFDMTTAAESVGGSFSTYRVDQIAGANFSISTGECTVVRRTGDLNDVAYGVLPAGLDAGAALSLRRPAGADVSVPKDATENSYNANLGTTPPGSQATLTQGDYRLSGPGGTQVGAFDVTINLPGLLTWTNEAATSEVDRSKPLPVQWSGVSAGLVTIAGFAGQQIGGTESDPIYDVAAFVCIRQASENSYSVPTSVLQQLPAAAFDPLGGNPGVGLLSVIAVPSLNDGKFNAPLTSGGSVESRFSYAVGHAKMLAFK